MKISEKTPYLKQWINSISRHDDADFEEVESALTLAKKHIDDELAAARKRRTVQKPA